MSDNRARPKIHRTDDKHDKALRAYAAEHGIEPWKALEVAIQRLAWTDGPTIDTLRADLESAREATRRADAEVEQLRSQVAGLGRTVDAYSAKVASLKSELAASQARERQADEGAMDARAEAAPCACALPDDFEAKIAERAPGWKGTADELRARVITLGFSRYDALATDAAKRAAERGR